MKARRIAIGVATLAVTFGVVVGVYKMGGEEGGAGQRNAAAAEGPSLDPADQARVARLMQRLEANPSDAAALVALGDVYFRAGDYNSAGSWMDKAVALDPGNVRARLALGAALFNLGDAADARRQWLRVIALDPGNVEAHYDLGFLYLSEDPPDLAEAKKMWSRLLELAPDSPVAKTVATHLEALEKRSER